MTETSQPTPAKKPRKAQGPRTVKPIYAVVTYSDENGNPVRLAKANLSIVLVRDASAIVEMLENGAGDATIARVNLPATPTRASAAA